MRWRILWLGVMLAVSVLTGGCQKADGGSLFGKAVSEGSVSVQSIDEASMKKYSLANDSIVINPYYIEGAEWLFRDLNGKKKYAVSGEKEIKEKLSSDGDIQIHWVTNDWLYFEWEPKDADRQKTNGGFCRVPLSVEGDTVKLDAENLERLHELHYSEAAEDESNEYIISSVVVTDDYVIFDCPRGSADAEGVEPYDDPSYYYCYNFKDKKENRILEDVTAGRASLELVTDDLTEMPLIMKGCLVFKCDPAVYGACERALYLIEPGSFQARKVYEETCGEFEGLKPSPCFHNFQIYGDNLLFIKENMEEMSLVQVNVCSEDEVKVLPAEALYALIDDADLWEKKGVHDKGVNLQDCFVDGDMLYLSGQTRWKKKETAPDGGQKGKVIERMYDRNFLLKFSLMQEDHSNQADAEALSDRDRDAAEDPDITAIGAWENCGELSDYIYEHSSHEKTYSMRDGLEYYEASEAADIRFVWKGNVYFTLNYGEKKKVFHLEDGKISSYKKGDMDIVPLSRYSWMEE